MSIQATSAPPPEVDGLHRAGWVVKDSRTIIPNGYVLVSSGKIREIGSYGKKMTARDRMPVRDHGSGALIPALVNAHTHLELSGFKGKISCQKGFRHWVQDLLQLREHSTETDLRAGALQGLDEIRSTGTGTLCEISSLGLTERIVSGSGLYGVWCREVLGNFTSEPKAIAETAGRVSISLAGHAPHTTAPELLTHLKAVTEARRLPFPIHLSESADEMVFISSGQGAWADFLASRGIDFLNWKLPAYSPVAYLDRLGILNASTLAVHLLRVDGADLDLVKQRGTTVCVCPRSNQALHSRLPDIPAMLARSIPLCLGTDSLASTPSLDLFEEMAFIARHFESVDPTLIFQMATFNGAQALLQTTVGTLSPGLGAQMVYVPVSCATDRQLMEAIVNKGFNGPCKPLF